MSLFDPIKPYLWLIRIVLFAAVVASALAYGYWRGHENGIEDGESKVRRQELKAANDQAKAAEDNAKAANEAAERYRLRAEAQEAVAAQYLEQLNKGNDRADKLAADLRAGTARFNRLWSECEAMSAPGAPASGAVGADAGADDRAASAARIVRAAAACDAQVKGLQAILIQERQAK